MHRRALLVTLAGFAGCTSAVPNPFRDRPEVSTGAPPRATRGKNEGDEESPETAVDPDSSVSTPSAADLEGKSAEELLDIARAQTNSAVEAYVGPGERLTDVTAASTAFDPSPVVQYLYGAQSAYEAIGTQGVSEEHRGVIEQLRHAGTFLRLTIDAQVQLIEAHEDLWDARDAVRRVDAEGVGSAVSRGRSRRDVAARAVSDMSERRYSMAMGAVERLSSEEYDTKLRQFEAEVSLLSQLFDKLSPVVEGVSLLARSKNKQASGAPYVANDLAKQAETQLSRGSNGLGSLLASFPPRAGAFQSVIRDLRSGTEELRADARRIYE